MGTEGKVMATKKEKWDGRSRPSDDNYRKRWNEIFGSREQDELNESYKQSLKNKKERTQTLHEELMEGFEMEKKMREEE
jgi:hypothetical protein